MIIKSYEIKNKIIFSKHKSFLLYGENVGLKKDIKKFISSNLKLKDNNIENVSIEESEIINNEEVFYNHIYFQMLKAWVCLRGLSRKKAL